MLAGHWWIAAAFAALLLLSWLLRRWSASGLAATILSIYVLLAAIGALMALSVPLLILGTTAALAGWDLTLFSQDVNDSAAADAAVLIEESHLRWLALAGGTGAGLAYLSSAIPVRLPFVLTVALVLLAVGGLVFGLRYFGRRVPGTSRRD